MGNLTTLTIYNDGLDQIREHPEQFAEKVYEAASSMTGPVTLRIGNHCNLVKVQKTRHADDSTIYVHMGNTVCEMSAYSNETLRIMTESPDFFEKMLKEMNQQTKILKKNLKQYREDKANERNANR